MSKEKHYESIGYRVCRYFVPSSLTASQTTKKGVTRARKGSLTSPLTYKHLLEMQATSVQLDTLNTQTAANRATALRAFLKANCIAVDDVVGDEMRMQFNAAMERFIDALTSDGRSQRNISNTCSAIRRWKEAVVQHDTARALDANRPTPFREAIQSLLSERPLKRVAKDVGVPPDMLRGWTLGKRPRPSSAKYIMRLEGFFALERNSLLHLAGLRCTGSLGELGGSPIAVPYNERLKTITKDAYLFKAGPGSQLRRQWMDLLRYKTERIPAEMRHKRGQWRFSPCPLVPKTAANWWMFYGGREVASARLPWARTASYLGWLQCSIDDGGKDMDTIDVGTIAWLAVPDHLIEYFDWMKERVGKHNQSVNQFLGLIASLVRPQLGYLWQHPELQATLPKKYHAESWESLCTRQFKLTERLVGAFRHEIEVSRDSFQPIRPLIETKRPLDAIADMIHRMKADRPVGNPRKEAVWGRDLVLIRILISNPLRLRNLAHLTWREDNTGHLYQRQDGSWWIRVPKSQFKNTRGAAGDQGYDSPVHQTAWQDIERYITVLRPRLLRHPSDLFILSYCGDRQRPHKPWSDLSKRISWLTVKYVPRCPGFSAHAFRHLVATSILKADGGDFKTAALVLNDRVSTVEKHYAALRSGDGAERMAQLLEESFAKM